MGVYQPITRLYSALYIKPRNFATRQYKLQWLAPPIYEKHGGQGVGAGQVFEVV